MADSQFWRAYALACMNVLNNPTLGQDQVIFIASTGERSVAAGKTVPYQITNAGIYNIGDALQNFNNAYFSTGGNDKYSQRLLSYLNNVVPQSGDVNAKDAFNAAQKEATKAINAYMKKYNADMKKYKNDTDADKGKFLDWASNNDPNLGNLFDNMTGATGQLAQARKKYFGPDATQLNTYLDNVGDAVNASSSKTGMNMPTFDGSLSQLDQINSAQKKGEDSPIQISDSMCTYQPVYSMDPTYGEQLDIWATSNGAAQSSTVKMSQGESFDMAKLGFSSSSSTSFDMHWLSWDNTSVQNSSSSRAYNSTSNSQDISLKMTWTDSALFDIAPAGKWNLNGPSLYPNTSNAFHGTQNWARASKLLCAADVTLEITFNNQTKSDFETDLKTSSSSQSSGMNIFGFTFNTSSSATNNEETTHNCKYDNDSGTLTIAPRPAMQTCTLLGVIANTVQI